MSNGYSLLRAFNTIGLILTLGISMSADAGLFGFGGHTMRWKEEVLLHDGQIIVAERFYNLGGYPEPASRERAALDETVTFSLPGTNRKITWKTDFRDTEPEPNSLNLILFDVVKGVPYIATYPTGCIAYNKWKRPNPPQVLFKYENDQWKHIAVADFPAELTKANVIVGRPATSLLQSFYTVVQVNEENRDIHTPEYNSILRIPMAKAGGNCGEMVYDGKGGWRGIDWFSDQPTYAACLKYCEQQKIDKQYCPCDTLFKGKK